MLNELKGNIWGVHSKFDWVGVTTNSTVIDGLAVMGGGIAKEAKDRYVQYPRTLALHLEFSGNIPLIVPDFHSFTFPTKHDVWKDSDPMLIIKSYNRLENIIQSFPTYIHWHIPRPGCGLGGLEWNGEDGVASILNDIVKVDNVYFWSFE